MADAHKALEYYINTYVLTNLGYNIYKPIESHVDNNNDIDNSSGVENLLKELHEVIDKQSIDDIIKARNLRKEDTALDEQNRKGLAEGLKKDVKEQILNTNELKELLSSIKIAKQDTQSKPEFIMEKNVSKLTRWIFFILSKAISKHSGIGRASLNANEANSSTVMETQKSPKSKNRRFWIIIVILIIIFIVISCASGKNED